jgi:membrane protease YdiL (CAAX protease family)
MSETIERKNSFIPLVGFFGLALLSASLFGFIATALMAMVQGQDLSHYSSLKNYLSDPYSSLEFKIMNSFFLFGFSIFPVILYRLLERDLGLKDLLSFKKMNWKILLWCLVGMVGTGVLVDQINGFLEPAVEAWMRAQGGYWMEMDRSMKSTYELTSNIQGGWDWAISILGMVLIPAIGEEWVFRGVMFRYLERMGLKPNAVIWISAVTFSAFHMHPSGFVGRVLLGAALGMMVSKTRNIGYPIAAHGVNNLLALLVG